MVSMPWAMTSGRPTSWAKRSFQWIGLKSTGGARVVHQVARVIW